MKKFLGALLVIFIALAVIVQVQDEDFTVQRSRTFAAPVGQIFPFVNQLDKWAAWSPWADLDPEMKTSLEGPESGKGAISRWSGNKEVGEGSMTITEMLENEKIRFDLKFIKPWEASSVAEFTFKDLGDKTEVTWTMSGKRDFLGKAMSLVIDCDKMLGGQFEKGLDKLGKVVIQSGEKQELPNS